MKATMTERAAKAAGGFPDRLLPLLRCFRDGAELVIHREERAGSAGLIDGSFRCTSCSQEYAVEGGVVRMMLDTLTPENAHELALKDREYQEMPDEFVPATCGWRSEYGDRIEIPPHLEALEPLDDLRLLEFGCGDGRLTLLAAQLGAEVLAVDISKEGLRKLADRLSSGQAPTTFQVKPRKTVQEFRARVGLVQADASHFAVASRSFHRVLAATPLDSRDERMRMYRMAAESLVDGGRYVGGVEHDDLCRRLLGLPVARRYTPGGIFIEHLSIPQMRREAAPYFSRLQVRPIRAFPPFIRKLPVKLAAPLSLGFNSLPGLRHFGTILLMCAERPIRHPAEGLRRPGSALAKTFYRKYKRWRAEEPFWDHSEEV